MQNILGKQIYEEYKDRLEDSNFALLKAPSGFGKTMMLKYMSNKLQAYYLGSKLTLMNDSIINNIALGSTFDDRYLRFLEDINLPFDVKIEDINITLSRGQIQRICFFRGLNTNANILLFDEVLNGIQSDLLDDMMDFTKKILFGKKFFMVCHNYQPKTKIMQEIILC